MEKALKPIAEQAIVNLSTRYVRRNKLTLMAVADGFVMYRNGTELRPNIMELNTWLKLPEK
jgi:hypothetical protein